jgi:cellulose synthase (UDP-forming)
MTTTNQNRLRVDLSLVMVSASLIACFLFLVVARWDDLQGACVQLLANFDSFIQNQSSLVEKPVLIPLLSMCCGAAISYMFPPGSRWTRAAVVALTLLLGARYLLWRLFVTVDFPDPVVGTYRVGFACIDLLIFTNTVAFFLQTIFPTNRSSEADKYSRSVMELKYCPTVDILVPTYNESTELLRRSLIGCQAIDYPNKNVYLLDEKSRPEMRALCEELGCLYITRNDNFGAKAGNLNNALNSGANSELIVVFDADFVPTRNFLLRTVGFFQDPRCGMVQTPQVFYTADVIQRNLGLSETVTHEEDLFFRVAQPGRDHFNACICHGTSFIVRREAIEKIGGFPTETITEDFFTGIKLQAAGYDVRYLNEAVSAGDSAADLEGFVGQRLRWAQGTWQVLFSPTSPITIPGLKLSQRIVNFSSILHWLTGALNLFPLLAPLPFLFFDISPMKADITQASLYYLPYYLFRASTHTWFSHGRRSFFWSDIYAPVLAVPLFLTLVNTLREPFGAPFKVTRKGESQTSIRISWELMTPLIILLGLYLMGLLWFGGRAGLDSHDTDSAIIMLCWSIYNLVLIALAAQACVNVTPAAATYNKVRANLPAEVTISSDRRVAIIKEIWDNGAMLELTQSAKPGEQGSMTAAVLGVDNLAFFIDENIRTDKHSRTLARVQFFDISTEQQRSLIEYLYCEPGRWQPKTVSEATGIAAVVSSVFRLYPLAEA